MHCTPDGPPVRTRDALGSQIRHLEKRLEELARKVAACGPAPTAPDLTGEPRVGRTVGPYRVLERIGAGGMGTVYRAEDQQLGRQVALKFLAANRRVDAAARRQLDREARLGSALNHPNICTVHAVDDDAGTPFIVMELLEGETLRQRLRHASLPVPVILDIAIAMADALDLIHGHGLVHRDVKPANIFITTRGIPKLLDFGLARFVEPAVSDTETPTVSAWWTPIDGREISGTPGYMSPEQARGLPIDGRTDLFSLGAVLYEMATGRSAFTTSADAAADTPTRSLSDGMFTIGPAPGLAPIVARALQVPPADRYPSARSLLVDLHHLKLHLDANSGGGGRLRIRPLAERMATTT